ncbi:O-antigen ligase domain-containing protein [Candidatus Parcubacteria bacterium]|nr:MAG: O-antigen ligase domain-containing protein [Candidatus Parcubacteria bacterium]
MKTNFLQRLEQIIFFVLVFAIPFQLRFVLHSYGISTLEEFNTLFLYFTDILIVALLIVFFMRYVGDQPLKNFLRERWRVIHESDPLYLFLVAFFILTILASFPPRSIAVSLYHIAKTAEFLLFFVYIVLAFRQYSLTAILKVFVASAFIQGVIGFFQFTFEKSLSLTLLGEAVLAPDLPEVVRLFVKELFLLRPYGTFPHPHLLAIFLVLGLFFISYMILKKRFFGDYPNPGFLPKDEERRAFKDSFIRIGMLVVVFIMLVGLALTFSRSIIVVGIAFLLAGFFWLYSSSWGAVLRERSKYLMFVFLIFVIIIAFMFRVELFERFQLVGQAALSGFGVLDKTALDFIAERPLFGVGAGYYPIRLAEVNPDLGPLQLQPVNNIYLLIAAETGVVNLIFFIAFLGYLMFGLVRAFRQETDLVAKFWKQQLIAVFAFLLISSFFYHGFWTLQQGRLIFWFSLGILVATATETKKDLIDSAI